MKRLITIIALFILANGINAYAQKKPLDHDDVLGWKRITEQRISNDGQYLVYKTEPWKGDPVLYISSTDGKKLAEFPCGTRSAITNDSRFVVFTIQPADTLVRNLKLKKTPKDQMPGSSLMLYELSTGKTDSLGDLKSFELPDKWAGFIAYQTNPGKKVNQPKKKESNEAQEEAEKESKNDSVKAKTASDKNGFELILLNTKDASQKTFPFVTEYHFAAEKELLVFVSTGADSVFDAGVYTYHPLTDALQLILPGTGSFSQMRVSENGAQIAFLADLRPDTERKKKESFNLYFWKGSGEAEQLADNGAAGIPENYEISKNGRLTLSASGNRVFFGIAPLAAEKDTSLLDEEKPVLDIWHWNEPVLQTVQLKNKTRDERKTYLTVCHVDSKEIIRLETDNLTSINLIREGDADQLVATSNLPYAVQSMWEGSPSFQDVYLIDIQTGEATMIKEAFRAYPQISPEGQYLYWYNVLDTTWNTYEIASGKEFIISHPKEIQAADELNDVPNPPGSYGSPGWLKGDEAMLVYDRYNVWQLDPRNEKSAKNLTMADPADGISFRIVDFDRRESMRHGMDPGRKYLLTGNNEKTREDGYYDWSLKKPAKPKELISGPFNLGSLQKAKDTDVVLFTMEDFITFPDLHCSDLKFKTTVRLSEANPQQADFIWGTAELVSWTSLDGKKLEGTLHKPENFDPDKKYPMIVNFYEKSSQQLFSHRIPERGRSTIDYHYYTSNGYLVFNPDIYYKEGYPGEDAFNCVMPGITALIEKGFVDEKAIGAQGHSWGGYQVAYLATRTNIFAAIESGAPVVNMFSAYGGIRWGSGLNRAFQYEHSQSRIGKSIWESPLRYLENSPLFTMDKVQTPILIMHNDDDGAVPWYQGIEYFIALRRLGKQAWMLNYNNADHWPTRLADKHDFQIRMAQFFDHFLKGAPMPEWMEKGIPATEKGINPGY